ncbi:TorD/DmsD family molecular chaperone [Dichotomicrobium thermohalophilum]|nr:molecular chaperone TorD family protein [Dichotomicrobium thermohalophilum]
MSPSDNTGSAVQQIAPEDESRAAIYAMLAKLLSAPPSSEQLADLAKLQGSDTDFGQAIAKLSQAARDTTVEQEDDAYHDLFIGLTRGKLLPYGSYYLTGFLHEKPLARLRNTMAQLGIEANPDEKDPEDHIASVLDMMGGLIRGDFGQPVPVAQQRIFFQEHVQSWAPYFFRDLEKVEDSKLYAAIGTVGRVFLELEEAAFSMD